MCASIQVSRLAPVVGVLGPLDQSPVRQAVHRARHRRGAHSIAGGQLRRGLGPEVMHGHQHRELVRRDVAGALEPHAAGDALAGDAEVVGEGEEVLVVVRHGVLSQQLLTLVHYLG